MKAGTIIGIGVFLAAGYFAFQANRQQGIVVKRDKQLVDSSFVITRLRKDSSNFSVRIWNLSQDSLKKEVTIGKLAREKAEAIAAGFVIGNKLDQKESEINLYSRSLTALKKKAAADRLVGGVGAVGTTIDQEELNGEIASLKGQVSNYKDSVVPTLVKTNTTLAIDKKAAEERAYTSDTLAENANKKIAGVRKFVQDKRQAKSKGLGKVFKAGQIRVLGEVDTHIRDIQNQR